MIIDTSVLVALMREEPETARFVPIMNDNFGSLRMPATAYLEAAIVIDSNDDEVLSERLDAVIQLFAIEEVPIDRELARMARYAYQKFGKGRHPAKLNFGDCFSYALSRYTADPLLFKGNDFAQTDVLIASLP